jgi:protein TonB
MKKLITGTLLILAAAAPLSAAVEPPVPIRTVAPNYPQDMRVKQESGIVQVNFLVDAHGAVQDAKVVKASDQAFSEPALEAVKKWKFKPAEKDGSIVAVRVTIPIRFDVAS